MAREDENVPPKVRRAIIERDGSCCRVCGVYVQHPALHHIDYRSQGGRHTPDNLIVIGWLPGHDCHLPVVHANKRLWLPILKIVVASPAGVTGLSVRRAQLAELKSENVRPRRDIHPLERPPRIERPLVGWPVPPVPPAGPGETDLPDVAVRGDLHLEQTGAVQDEDRCEGTAQHSPSSLGQSVEQFHRGRTYEA